MACKVCNGPIEHAAINGFEPGPLHCTRCGIVYQFDPSKKMEGEKLSGEEAAALHDKMTRAQRCEHARLSAEDGSEEIQVAMLKGNVALHLEQVKAMLDAAGIEYEVEEDTDDYGEDDGTLGGTLLTIRGAGDQELQTGWSFHKDGHLLFVTNFEGEGFVDSASQIISLSE